MKTKVIKEIALLLIFTFSFSNYGYAWVIGHAVVDCLKFQIYHLNYYQDDYTDLRASVEGYTSDCPSNLTIPTEILYSIQKGSEIVTYTVPVSSIKEKAFFECNLLKSLTIPCMNFGNSAFEGCQNLESVDWQSVPASHVFSSDGDYDAYTMTAERVFAGCVNLQNVSLPSELELIGNEMFANCTALANIGLPSSLKEIGSGAFQGCTALANISLPQSLIRIGGQAFQGCTALEELLLPISLTYIGECAFRNCISLRNIYCNSSEPFQIDYSHQYQSSHENYGQEFGSIHPHSVLHVPKGTRYDYAMMGLWNGICFIRENGVKIICELDELSNSKAYRIQAETARRGFLYPSDDVLVSRGGSGDYYYEPIIIDDKDESQQFAIYKKEEKYYLYNIGKKKFVSGYGHRFISGWGQNWNDANVVQFLLSNNPGYDVSITSSSVAGEFIFSLGGNEWINLSVSARNGVGDLGCVGGWKTEDGGNRLEIVEVADLSEDIQGEIEKSFEHQIIQIGNLSQLSNEKSYLLNAIQLYGYDETAGVVYATTATSMDFLKGTINFPHSGFDAVNKNDLNLQFALYKYGDEYYLYNVGRSKFIDDNIMLSNTPCTTSIQPDFLPGRFNFSVNDETMSIQGNECYEIYELGVLSNNIQHEIKTAIDVSTRILLPFRGSGNVQYYDLHGCRHSTVQRGVNIIRLADGSTRKVLVK